MKCWRCGVKKYKKNVKSELCLKCYKHVILKHKFKISMKKKIKKLFIQVGEIDAYRYSSIRLYGDDSGNFISTFDRVIFEFTDMEELKKGMKKIIKEQTK